MKSSPAFPLDYTRYIEVFGGAGWVLFRKPPGYDFEVFNDLDGNLVNLYRCVREQPQQLKEEIRYLLNSRLDFEHMKRLLHERQRCPTSKGARITMRSFDIAMLQGRRPMAASPMRCGTTFR